MKKLLSVLLAVCMVLGVGAMSVHAITIDDLTFEEFIEQAQLTWPIDAYGFVFGYYPRDDGSFIPALYVSQEAVDGLLDGAADPGVGYHSILRQFGLFENDDIATKTRNGTLQAAVEQAVLALEALWAEIYTEVYLDKFAAFKEAFVNGNTQFLHLHMLFVTKTIVNIAEISQAFHNLEDWFYSRDESRGAEELARESGTLAELTTVYTELETRAKAIIDRIVFTDPGTDPEQQWWQRLPSWIQWILYYLFFGWVGWMAGYKG